MLTNVILLLHGMFILPHYSPCLCLEKSTHLSFIKADLPRACLDFFRLRAFSVLPLYFAYISIAMTMKLHWIFWSAFLPGLCESSHPFGLISIAPDLYLIVNLLKGWVRCACCEVSPYHGLEGSEDLPQLPPRPHFPICSASHSSILTQKSSRCPQTASLRAFTLAFTTVQSTLLSRCVPWLIPFLNLGLCCSAICTKSSMTTLSKRVPLFFILCSYLFYFSS